MRVIITPRRRFLFTSAGRSGRHLERAVNEQDQGKSQVPCRGERVRIKGATRLESWRGRFIAETSAGGPSRPGSLDDTPSPLRRKREAFALKRRFITDSN